MGFAALNKRIIALVGPTGIGKTETAAALAKTLSAKVVVADSMQVYQGMDVGTGKPDKALLREIAHYGIDLVPPTAEFSAADYVRTVRPVMEKLLARDDFVVLTGGSGLYVRALLDGICEAPSANRFYREQLLEEGQKTGWSAMHRRLQEVDPEAARRIHPHDKKRIIRALEVFHDSGQPLTALQKKAAGFFENKAEISFFGLTCHRETLYQRIEERIDRWLASGWKEEAQMLLQKGLSKTSAEALGYKELYAYLKNETSWEETVRLIKRNSRHYAKRQITWFHHDPRIRWIPVEDRSPRELALVLAEDRIKNGK
ncbi:MAG: tRNA (adenosine(37)-N6)-dimethylallyltransferase MiaA [Candidatus Omnitrophica bacterium]|nr:tRNA (adenosine(37)-N6)-dimethylallyltransferase MiaA [Candidatus Omnitrophota bacterium]